jgi:hypothetical protein
VAQMIGSVKYFKAKKISHMKKASYTFQGWRKWWEWFEPVTICVPPLDTSGRVWKKISTVHHHWSSDSFLCIPFTCQIEVTETAAAIERFIQARAEEQKLEILDLQNDIVLKSYTTHKRFWNLVDQEVSFLKSAVYKMKPSCRNTYLCKSLFSLMNSMKSKNRSWVTNTHRDSFFQTGILSWHPSFKELAEEMQHQRSHWQTFHMSSAIR